MSIEQPDVVDFVRIDKRTGDVVLTISDHLDWVDEIQHLRLLQDKIENYVRFIDCGQLLEEVPAAAGRSVSIEIVKKYPLSDSGRRFLAETQQKLSGSVRLKQQRLPRPWWQFWDRRRRASNLCRICDYDLTGNVSGVCPECGTPIDSRESESV